MLVRGFVSVCVCVCVCVCLYVCVFGYVVVCLVLFLDCKNSVEDTHHVSIFLPSYTIGMFFFFQFERVKTILQRVESPARKKKFAKLLRLTCPLR